MAIQDIPATTPTTAPPVPQMVYDQWVLVHMETNTPDPNGPTSLQARFRKANKDGNGVWTLADRANDTIANLQVADVLALAAQNPALGSVVDGVLAALVQLATADGLL